MCAQQEQSHHSRQPRRSRPRTPSPTPARQTAPNSSCCSAEARHAVGHEKTTGTPFIIVSTHRIRTSRLRSAIVSATRDSADSGAWEYRAGKWYPEPGPPVSMRSCGPQELFRMFVLIEVMVGRPPLKGGGLFWGWIDRGVALIGDVRPGGGSASFVPTCGSQCGL